MIVIGIMSGTSCDGADAVALDLESVSEPHEPRVLAHTYEPYPPLIRQALQNPEKLTIPILSELHFALPEIYARAALALDVSGASVCGVHGQTVWHAPPSSSPSIASTLQIGSTAILAHRLGIPVVGDFRGADIAEGGEGAPIVPFSHWFFTPEGARPRLIVNIGGIANVTVVRSDLDGVLGFDVGPGMMIADAFAQSATNGSLDCDRDGQLSRGGEPIPELVEKIASHPFVARTPPKSTGREAFGSSFFEPLLDEFRSRPVADVLTSILAGTARCIALSAIAEKMEAGNLVLTGGGAKNPTLVAAVARELPLATLSVVDRGVFLPVHHEPAAMALYAARTIAGLPSSLPRVTGARRRSVLGHIHHP